MPFNTNYYQSRLARWKNQEMTLNNAVKTEAFDLLGLVSMRFEKEHYGWEYNHYLNLLPCGLGVGAQPRPVP